MNLETTINLVKILAEYGRNAIRENGGNASPVYMDVEELQALRSAVEILEDVQAVRRLLTGGEKDEA